MIWYILLITLIFLFRLLFEKKLFCLSSGILLWLLLALRSVTIGLNDTLNIYRPFFFQLDYRSFADLLNYKWFEFGFSLFSKILSFFIDDYQLYISILAIPYIYFTMRLIYNRSKFPLLSIIIFISLYYMYGTFLLRQVIAIGILTLAIDAIEDRKLLKFVICIVIASFFHKSSLVFLIAYPFSNYMSFSKKNYIYILISYLFASFFGPFILKNISYFDFTGKVKIGIENDIYSTDSGISMFGLVINTSIIVFSDIFYKKAKDSKMNAYLNIATLGAMFYCFSKIVTEFYRISMYFSFINILMVPRALEKVEDNRFRFLIELALILVFIAYFLIRTINNVNANPYSFCF